MPEILRTVRVLPAVSGVRAKPRKKSREENKKMAHVKMRKRYSDKQGKKIRK